MRPADRMGGTQPATHVGPDTAGVSRSFSGRTFAAGLGIRDAMAVTAHARCRHSWNRLGADLVRDFDEIPVRIAEVQRAQGSARAQLVDGTELDLDGLRSQMLSDCSERNVGGEA